MFNSSFKEVVSPTNFPDGTKLLKFEVDDGADYRIVWLYDNDEELFQLIALVKHIKSKGGKVWLTLPYVPNARMDRTKNDDEVFTLKAFAETINWLGFEQVTICNPHSTVSEALFDRVSVDFDCVVEDVKKIVDTSTNGIDVLYYPDLGAQKRYNDILAPFGLPFAYGIKNRDWKTGKILGLNVVTPIDLTGKNILIIDDICSRGTTFVKSAEKLKELGAGKIALYVTHCENTINDGEVLKNNGLIDIVYTTNSIFRGVASHKLKIVREF
jgi:ribose-phosphate pyrophosphokinase